METKAEIKKVVLKVNDKEISLTLEEAKKLKELLGTLFGNDVVKEYIIKDNTIYVERPYYPYRRYWDCPVVTWTSSAGDMNYKSGAVYCSLSSLSK